MYYFFLFYIFSTKKKVSVKFLKMFSFDSWLSTNQIKRFIIKKICSNLICYFVQISVWLLPAWLKKPRTYSNLFRMASVHCASQEYINRDILSCEEFQAWQPPISFSHAAVWWDFVSMFLSACFFSAHKSYILCDVEDII